MTVFSIMRRVACCRSDSPATERVATGPTTVDLLLQPLAARRQEHPLRAPVVRVRLAEHEAGGLHALQHLGDRRRLTASDSANSACVWPSPCQSSISRAFLAGMKSDFAQKLGRRDSVSAARRARARC